MHKVDSPEDRIQARQRLNQLAKELLTGEYQRRMEDIEDYDPENPSHPITNLLIDARDHLSDLDAIDRETTLAITPCDLNQDLPDRQWLIKKWLPAHCVSMITGEGGVGKSYAALQISAALACGVTDEYIFKPSEDAQLDADRGVHSIVYAAWEDEPIESMRRLKRIAKTLKWIDPDKLNQYLHFVDMKGRGPIWGHELSNHISARASLLDAGVQLTKFCEDEGASFLILDPGAGAFGGNENDRAAVREYTSFLNAWGQDKECATLILAHPPKNEETYSGSTDWLGSVRSLWNIGKRKDTEKKEQYFSIKHEKSNYAPLQSERYMTKPPNSGVWLEVNSRDHANIAQPQTDKATKHSGLF